MISLGNTPGWIKSSRSAGESNCVEISSPLPEAVLMTDSKTEDCADRPILSVSPAAFEIMIRSVRA